MLRSSFYDKNEMGVPERKWINLDEYYDIEYWSAKFGITPELLRNAVKEAGTNVAEEVEKYIKSKYPFQK